MRFCVIVLVVGGLALPGCGTDDPASAPNLDVQLVLDADPGGALFSVWGSGPSDMWVVGGQQGIARVHHWTGSWESPDVGIEHQLWWVHGFEGGPVFVVGDRGSSARRETSGAWTALAGAPAGTRLFGVWGASPEAMWAVGGPDPRAPDGVDAVGDILLRLSGDAWEQVAVSALEGRPATSQNLFKVWGADADHAWVVGSGGMILAWDGEQWAQQGEGVTSGSLFTVTGTSASDVWAVGGSAAGGLVHYDGTTWSSVELPEDAPQIVQGIWVGHGGRVYLAGTFGWLGMRAPDGVWTTNWTDTPDAFHAISAAGGLWVVGGNIAGAELPTYNATMGVSDGSIPPPE